MKIVRYRRPPIKEFRRTVAPDAWAALARRVWYGGSAHHKLGPSFAGNPRPRADATPCPRKVTQAEADGWLKDAVRKGGISEASQGDWPAYIWYKTPNHGYFQAKLTNQSTGEYHGYPVPKDQVPIELQ